MKPFRCGLVVGKFSPLHFGHEQVIRRALAECDDLILLSYSQPEFPGCKTETRELWLRTRFPQARTLVVSDQRLQQWPELQPRWSTVPNNDAPADIHRAFCADLCSNVLGATVDAVYSSEDYGPGFAQFLTEYYRQRNGGHAVVTSVLVDLARAQNPISGTALRADFDLLQKWTAPEVYASFVQRICFLGGESSGKSTLAKALATKFKTKFAAEYGRELWEQKAGDLQYDDLLAIARRQIEREETLALAAHRYLFCDTSPLTTLYYSLDLFGKADSELVELSQRRYDLTILCAPDFPFFQDGTRRDNAFREAQHAWYIQRLTERGIPFHLVRGSVEQRVEMIAELLRRRS
jgi:NadR type nicotinamide-nucleotide adenylyltransferase